MSALNTQVAGDHYKTLKIQPVEYIHANGLGFIEGSIIKYATRWRDKGGVADLEKAKHFIDLLIEFERKKEKEDCPSRAATTGGIWIEWRGGKRPVAPLTKVDVHLNDGVVVLGAEAGQFHWGALPGRQVVAYRLHKEAA